MNIDIAIQEIFAGYRASTVLLGNHAEQSKACKQTEQAERAAPVYPVYVLRRSIQRRLSMV